MTGCSLVCVGGRVRVAENRTHPASLCTTLLVPFRRPQLRRPQRCKRVEHGIHPAQPTDELTVLCGRSSANGQERSCNSLVHRVDTGKHSAGGNCYGDSWTQIFQSTTTTTCKFLFQPLNSRPMCSHLKHATLHRPHTAHTYPSSRATFVFHRHLRLSFHPVVPISVPIAPSSLHLSSNPPFHFRFVNASFTRSFQRLDSSLFHPSSFVLHSTINRSLVVNPPDSDADDKNQQRRQRRR